MDSTPFDYPPPAPPVLSRQHSNRFSFFLGLGPALLQAALLFRWHGSAVPTQIPWLKQVLSSVQIPLAVVPPTTLAPTIVYLVLVLAALVTLAVPRLRSCYARGLWWAVLLNPLIVVVAYSSAYGSTTQ
jgi:hypothetical protein